MNTGILLEIEPVNVRFEVFTAVKDGIKMEVIRSSETPVYIISIRCHIPEDDILQNLLTFKWLIVFHFLTDYGTFSLQF
jgi:hypothetical protein